MNRNVEIKARVESLDEVERRAQALADEGPVVLEQEDTFFICPHGRLKLRRRVGGGEGELIYYERSDTSAPKESRYAIQRTSDPTGLRAMLTTALGIRGVVRKRRTLYLIGPTRVHLDCVEGLGAFVELEVVLADGQSVRDGRAVADNLMEQLAISAADLVPKAYIDLLEALRSQPESRHRVRG
jgi:predicted adenylyl cyclase CyaB